MYLKDLIVWLEAQNPDAIVMHGFSKPMSYRGYYEELAFKPAEKTTFGDMLRYAKSALGETFTGYKGGSYTMHEYTPCWIAEYGRTGEEIGATMCNLWVTLSKKATGE